MKTVGGAIASCVFGIALLQGATNSPVVRRRTPRDRCRATSRSGSCAASPRSSRRIALAFVPKQAFTDRAVEAEVVQQRRPLRSVARGLQGRPELGAGGERRQVEVQQAAGLGDPRPQRVPVDAESRCRGFVARIVLQPDAQRLLQIGGGACPQRSESRFRDQPCFVGREGGEDARATVST